MALYLCPSFAFRCGCVIELCVIVWIAGAIGGHLGAASSSSAVPAGADTLVSSVMSPSMVGASGHDTILGGGNVGGAAGMKSPLQDLNEGSKPLEKVCF